MTKQSIELSLAAGLFLLAAFPCVAQIADTPQLSGYITHVASPQDFEVNGQHIVLSRLTEFVIQQPTSAHAKETYVSLQLPQLHPYLGEPVDVYGTGDKKQHSISATRLVLQMRIPHTVAGFGIVETLPTLATTPTATDHLVRADGYLILITANTRSTFDKPLISSSDIATNTWITFQGTQRADGIIAADKAHFSKNVVHSNEDNLREKTEYDPAAVPAGSKQSGTSKFFRGIDVKQLPPSADTAMQARIDAIGAKLIPKYQAALPDTDATRINFRFQVLDASKDTDKWRDAFTLPNGIILIPHAVVERLQNDSQVATVLADNIACALEKQPLSNHVLNNKLTATQYAADIGGLFIPGLGLAASIGSGAEATHVLHTTEDQSGRVSLWLLQDAGFDIYQAPIAWWLLASKKPQPLAATSLPRRAASLYQFLGDSWPQQQSSAAAVPFSTASSTTPPASAPAAPR